MLRLWNVRRRSLCSARPKRRRASRQRVGQDLTPEVKSRLLLNDLERVRHLYWRRLARLKGACGAELGGASQLGQRALKTLERHWHIEARVVYSGRLLPADPFRRQPPVP